MSANPPSSELNGVMFQKRKNKKGKFPKPQPPGELIHQYINKGGGPSRRNLNKKNHPSHNQMARLLGFMFLPEFGENIMKKMAEIVKRERKPGGMVQVESRVCVIGKTPKEWLVEATQDYKIQIGDERNADTVGSDVDAYFMEVILNRRNGKTSIRQKTESHNSETIPIMKYSKKIGCENDNIWSTVILVLPMSSVFYLSNHGYGSYPSTCPNQGGDGGFRCLPTSWLRIQRREGQPAKGSFIKKIVRCFPVFYTHRLHRRVIPCYQIDDYEEGAPLVSPDIFEMKSGWSTAQGRKKYIDSMKSSATFRYGCRRYVRGALHETLPTGMLVIDAKTSGNVTLAVTVRDSFGRPLDVSHVQVVDLREEKQTLLALVTGSLLLQNRPGNARQHAGDLGKMFGLGEMKITGVEGFTVTVPTLALAENGLLANINQQANDVCSDAFGSVVPTIKHMEKQAKRTIHKLVGGNQAISCSQDVSCDLGNASHYDVGDGSVGCSIWVELIPGMATNWYFVLPNILIKENNICYSGVAIKLYHGLGISWDGRVIRHGTTVTRTNSKKNHCLGWFWCADMKGASLSLKQNT
jgi:hypothetical protein